MTIDVLSDANHATVMVRHVFVIPKLGGFEFVSVLFHFHATASHAVTGCDVNQVVEYDRGGNDGSAASSNRAPKECSIGRIDAGERFIGELNDLLRAPNG